jgi:hypothetical protein
MNAFAHATLLLALSLSALPARSAQEETHPDDPRVVRQADVLLEQHRVQHVDTVELFELVAELAGRGFYVLEHGGFQSDELRNMRLLGDSIVLYDTQPQVQRIRELLARLDVAPPEAVDTRIAREYRPRFVTLGTVYTTAEPLVREASAVEERNLLVLHGTPAQVEEAMALLERIDRPEPQVVLTCQLLEVAAEAEAEGPPLARELVDNLGKLLPGTAFVQVGFSLLQTSVGGGSQISMQLESTGKRYLFSFTPAAYDETSGALTATSCMLVEMVEDEMRELFRTDAVLRGDEYTVLAATGATPRLLVLRVAPRR